MDGFLWLLIVPVPFISSMKSAGCLSTPNMSQTPSIFRSC